MTDVHSVSCASTPSSGPGYRGCGPLVYSWHGWTGMSNNAPSHTTTFSASFLTIARDTTFGAEHRANLYFWALSRLAVRRDSSVYWYDLGLVGLLGASESSPGRLQWSAHSSAFSRWQLAAQPLVGSGVHSTLQEFQFLDPPASSVLRQTANQQRGHPQTVRRYRQDSRSY